MSGYDDEPGEHERTMVVDARKLRPATSSSGSAASSKSVVGAPPSKPAAAAAPSPKPSKPNKPWRPFRHQGLERVSRASSAMSQQLRWLAPAPAAITALCERLSTVFGEPVKLKAEGTQVVLAKELRRHLSEPTFLTFLAAGTAKGRAVLEVELALAHAAVDMLLGGAGEAVGLRPLTDIEEGVMSFVVLEALKALSSSLEEGQPRPRLEGLGRGLSEALNRMGEEGSVAMVQLRASLGSHAGVVRLFLPAALLESLAPSRSGEVRRAHLRADVEAHLARLAQVPTWLRAEIAHVEISSGDLASLRIKDVLLVDSVSARPDKGEGGTALLRVGLGRQARMPSEIFLEGGQFQARITEIQLDDTPQRGRTPSASEEAAQAALQGEELEEYTNPELRQVASGSPEDQSNMDGANLLGDIPLQISVELARVPITADEVVALRPGQVIELHRAPGEPVELSVNGKVIARGELVEVEGHLGVRLLDIVG